MIIIKDLIIFKAFCHPIEHKDSSVDYSVRWECQKERDQGEAQDVGGWTILK
jgi:formate-dependent phosphoribosylglycinamide formyltransferase (GAR transformylase)